MSEETIENLLNEKNTARLAVEAVRMQIENKETLRSIHAAMKIAVALLTALLIGSGAALYNHESRISKQEIKVEGLENACLHLRNSANSLWDIYLGNSYKAKRGVTNEIKSKKLR